MTVRVFADERRWPLPKVSVRVDLVHAQDGALRLERTIALEGHLDPEQRDALLAVADRSPVLALLHPDIAVVTRLGPIDDPVEAERNASVEHWIALQQALRAR
jgi:putative redox protein